jgi:hypothetical protein
MHVDVPQEGMRLSRGIGWCCAFVIEPGPNSAVLRMFSAHFISIAAIPARSTLHQVSRIVTIASEHNVGTMYLHMHENHAVVPRC